MNKKSRIDMSIVGKPVSETLRKQLALTKILGSKNGNLETSDLAPATIKLAGEREVMTREEFKRRARELDKCRKDILYFCRNYFKIISLSKGKIQLDPYPK